MNQGRSVARRYARALLEVAIQQGRAETVARDISTVAATLAGHDGLRTTLTSPTVPVSSKRRIVSALWSRSVDPLIARLLELLTSADRLAEFSAVAAAFDDAWKAHRGIVPVEVVSATALAKPQTEALAEAVRRVTGKNVALHLSVDPHLLGGLLLRMDGKVYDGTVRSRMRALRSRLVLGTSHA